MIKLNYPKFWQMRNIISYVLLPFSLIYFLLSKLRKLAAKEIILPAKVICVGNITAGGTGKTQIVIFLAKWLQGLDIKFVIITKAYHSRLKTAAIVDNQNVASDVGDEALILKNYGPVIAAKKIKYASEFIKQLKPSIIIVDDGMQNPYFHKDFTILTIDGIRKFGNEFLIPAGPLRESQKQGEKKADIIIVVGENSNFNSSIPIFNAKIIPINKDLDKSINYFAFCGIGNPEKFFNSLKDLGLSVFGHKIFPDHHDYSSQDIKNLTRMTQEYDAILITTEKDYVKIQGRLDSICLKVEIKIEREQEFTDFILGKIR